MNNISLHVKGLGKIESATIELAPLTLFVGDNNSGKSYLMTVLYGLFDLETILGFSDIGFGASFKAGRTYRYCLDLLTRMEISSKDHYLTEEDHENFCSAFNALLGHNKNMFIEKIFNYNFSLDAISVNIPFSPNILLKHISSNILLKHSSKQSAVKTGSVQKKNLFGELLIKKVVLKLLLKRPLRNKVKMLKKSY